MLPAGKAPNERNGYLITFAVLLITGARLGQSHGYRRIFLLGVGVFTFASLLCSLAPSPLLLVLARVVQGAGAALMFPQTLTGIQLNFTRDGRKRAIGLTTAVPAEYLADISGVSTTALQIGAAIGVAAFGTLYLSLTSRAGAGHATHAFAITTAAFAVVALLATGTAALTTRQAPPVKSSNCDSQAEPSEAGNMRNEASLVRS